MSRIHRPFFLAILLALSATVAPPSRAAHFVFDPPAVDRWLYPFASSPGTRANASAFGAFATAGLFDERDAEVLVIFDTAPAIPAGRPSAAYQITSARVIFDRDPAASGFVYDPSYDGYRTYLALENASDPNQLPDTDAGRPIELYGVGYRLAGLDALTYNESGSPFGPSAPGQGLRYAYPNDFLAHPTLFGDRDVANNVLGGFEASPFAIGTMPGATPGSTVVGAGTIEANLALTPAVVAYLRNRLSLGSVDLAVTSLTPAAQGGPQIYPVLLNKESGTGAATLEIDVTWTAACADGIDNDGDGRRDYPTDPQCTSLADDRESAATCGLFGIEMLPLPAWIAYRRRRRR